MWRAIRFDLLEADEAEQAEEQAVDKAEPPLKKRKYLLVLILANWPRSRFGEYL